MPALTEIPFDVCERLLRAGHVGRIALVTPEGPEILPVNYAVRDDAIVVRTDPVGPIVRHGAGALVAFEVDAVDDLYWTGWSVLARGRGEVADPPPTAAIGTAARPWAGGDRSCEFRLSWSSLSGRRVGTSSS